MKARIIETGEIVEVSPMVCGVSVLSESTALKQFYSNDEVDYPIFETNPSESYWESFRNETAAKLLVVMIGGGLYDPERSSWQNECCDAVFAADQLVIELNKPR